MTGKSLHLTPISYRHFDRCIAVENHVVLSGAKSVLIDLSAPLRFGRDDAIFFNAVNGRGQTIGFRCCHPLWLRENHNYQEPILLIYC